MCGFYHAKATHIIAASKAVAEQFRGELPDTMEDLLRLPGVGRKTANVVLGDALGKPGFPVDTHVRRLARLIGLSDSDVPDEIESDVCAVMPPETWAQFSHLLIVHGRTRCPANRPGCSDCEIAAFCRHSNGAPAKAVKAKTAKKVKAKDAKTAKAKASPAKKTSSATAARKGVRRRTGAGS